MRFFLIAMLAAPTVAMAQGADDCRPGPRIEHCPVPKAPKKEKPPKDPPVIWGGGVSVDGKLRGVSLITFLERANEELERASLEKRSFVPEIVRSIDAESL